MNYLLFLLLVATAVLVTYRYRMQRDRDLLAAEVRQRGGEVLQLQRVRRGSPFTDTGRGWWAWRIRWRDPSGERTSWALTTREGLGEWRD